MSVKTEGTVRERTTTGEELTHADRVARGKDARVLAPLESHEEFTPDKSRDPVGLLLEQAVEEIFPEIQAEKIYKLIREVLGKYQRTLASDRKHLVEYFTLVQLARKVVGVGSAGTRAWIALMAGGHGTEPLFLQAKEAQPSVLAAYCGL